MIPYVISDYKETKRLWSEWQSKGACNAGKVCYNNFK